MSKQLQRIEKHPKKAPDKEERPVVEERKKPKKKLFRRGWFWAIVAVAVVAVTMTLACTLDYTIMAHVIRLGCQPKNVSTPADYAETKAATDVVYDVKYDSDYDNSYMDIFSAKNSGKKPLLVYVHGGYYLGGDKLDAEPYCRTIAANGYVVASLNYAYAPEVKYPGQVKQVNDAIKFLSERADEYGIDLNNVFLGGDSAGCHLVSEMGAAYTNPALTEALGITPALSGDKIRGILLVCGFFDLKTVRATRFPFVNTAMFAFTDKRDYENYFRAWELCTTETATSAYPASLFLCAQDDPFYSQSLEFEKVLRDLGVYTENYYPSSDHKLGHEFARKFNYAEASVAMERAIDFLNGRTEGNEIVKTPHVVFELSTGEDIDVTLYKRYAPATVENFLTYVSQGFYDGTTFHRVIKGYVLQGGGYEREGNILSPKATREPIVGEFAANGFAKNTLSHVAGAISMARTSVYDSATSQFFFCAEDCTAYDGQYAAFGQVTDPDDLAELKRLVNVDLNTAGSEGMPEENVYIVRATVRYE